MSWGAWGPGSRYIHRHGHTNPPRRAHANARASGTGRRSLSSEGLTPLSPLGNTAPSTPPAGPRGASSPEAPSARNRPASLAGKALSAGAASEKCLPGCRRAVGAVIPCGRCQVPKVSELGAGVSGGEPGPRSWGSPQTQGVSHLSTSHRHLRNVERSRVEGSELGGHARLRSQALPTPHESIHDLGPRGRGLTPTPLARSPRVLREAKRVEQNFVPEASRGLPRALSPVGDVGMSRRWPILESEAATRSTPPPTSRSPTPPRGSRSFRGSGAGQGGGGLVRGPGLRPRRRGEWGEETGGGCTPHIPSPRARATPAAPGAGAAGN